MYSVGGDILTVELEFGGGLEKVKVCYTRSSSSDMGGGGLCLSQQTSLISISSNLTASLNTYKYNHNLYDHTLNIYEYNYNTFLTKP